MTDLCDVHDIGHETSKYEEPGLALAMGAHSAFYLHVALLARYWPLDVLAKATWTDYDRLTVPVCEHMTLLRLDPSSGPRATPTPVLEKHGLYAWPRREAINRHFLLDEFEEPLDVRDFRSFEMTMRDVLKTPGARPWSVWTDDPEYWACRILERSVARTDALLASSFIWNDRLALPSHIKVPL